MLNDHKRKIVEREELLYQQDIRVLHVEKLSPLGKIKRVKIHEGKDHQGSKAVDEE